MSERAAQIARVLGVAALLLTAALAGWWLRRPPATRTPEPPPPVRARPPESAPTEEKGPAADPPGEEAGPADTVRRLFDFPPMTREEVRSKIDPALDLMLVEGGPGVVRLLELGPGAIPWVAGALEGKPRTGGRTMAQYVADYVGGDLDLRGAAKAALVRGGEEAREALREAAGDAKIARPRRTREGGIVIDPPRSKAERAARLLRDIEEGRARRGSDFSARRRYVMHLAVHASGHEEAKDALASYVRHWCEPGKDRESLSLEAENIALALRALVLSGPRAADRDLYERLASREARDGLHWLRWRVYAMAALERLGDAVDWAGMPEKLRRSPGGSPDLDDLRHVKPELTLKLALEALQEGEPPWQREETYRVLATLAPAAASGSLGRVATGDDPVEAARALYVLGLIPGKEAYDAIVRSLDAPTSSARRWACLALMFRPEDGPGDVALARVLSLLEDPSLFTGGAALSFLSTLDQPPPPPGAEPKRLPALMYSLWRSGAAAPEGLESRLKIALREARRGRALPSGSFLGKSDREPEWALCSLAGRLGATRRRGPSALTPAALVTWVRFGGLDERTLGFIVRMKGLRTGTSPRGSLWVLDMCKVGIDQGVADFLPTAILALDSDYPFIRARAAEFLREKAGGGYGFESDAPYPERAAAIARWWSWWAHERARLGGRWPAELPVEDEF